jgi:hypothetical protein
MPRGDFQALVILKKEVMGKKNEVQLALSAAFLATDWICAQNLILQLKFIQKMETQLQDQESSWLDLIN